METREAAGVAAAGVVVAAVGAAGAAAGAVAVVVLGAKQYPGELQQGPCPL